MAEIWKRTHYCGELRKEHHGTDVILTGWVQKRRDLGGVIFIDLRDRTGIAQIVINPDKGETFHLAERLRSEYVLSIKGRVRNRPEDGINENIETGEVEVEVFEMNLYNESLTPPFALDEYAVVDESIRLKYRYLDLRRKEVQKNFFLRHQVAKTIRNFLDEEKFIEIETPMLIGSTPEGARDFLVPSRVNPGKFYALPQSPQMYKQLLMVSGFERYYQIVKCFRDEDLRADRQPEFTQLDMELSFVDMEDILSLNERLMHKIFQDVLNIDIPIPLKRLSYEEAMESYGSDKPDTRFGLLLHTINHVVKDCGFKIFADAVAKGNVVKAINCKGMASMPRRDIDKLDEMAKASGAKGMAYIVLKDGEVRSPILKFLSEEVLDAILKEMEAEQGDLIIFVADTFTVANTVLNRLRLFLGEKYELIDESKLNFLWVTDFPMFEYDEENKRYKAMHHPFTMPVEEDIPYLESDPQRVKAKAYDMVLNGTELGGGSLRIYNADLQAKMFKALGFTDEEARSQFGFLMDAFQYGTPPHGGIAYGLDRLVMLMSGSKTIRECIAFPKTQRATDLMSGAPDYVTDKQLEELSIRTMKLD